MQINNNDNQYRSFDADYHKVAFAEKWGGRRLKRNPPEVKRFLSEDVEYYCRVYLHLLEKAQEPTSKDLYYSAVLNDLDRQYLLILAALELNDPEENDKIILVARLFDRHFTLLQLLGCYDNSRFGASTLSIAKAVRGKDLGGIQSAFDEQLLDDVNSHESTSFEDPFQYGLFRDAGLGTMSGRAVRYVLARVEHYIASRAQKPAEGYWNLVRNSGRVHGHHIEHIVANNEHNRELFGDDEDRFYTQRNRLGALLLLKGRDNISSNNEVYANKLRTYSHGTLWAQTLTEDFYKSNKDFEDFVRVEALDLEPIAAYDEKAIDRRQRLLFELVRRIWG